MAGNINFDQLKQQQQFMNMRGAQMAQDKLGQKTELGSAKAKGSKKQLIGTIIGVVAVVIVLLLLSRL